MSTLLSTSEGEAGGHRAMVGSNVLVNILKPVNIVNLGNTLRSGMGKRKPQISFFSLNIGTIESQIPSARKR